MKALKEGGDVSDALAKFETYKATMEPTSSRSKTSSCP